MKGLRISNVCFSIFSRYFLILSLMSRMPILYDYSSLYDLALFSFTLHYYISNIFYILIHLVYLFTGINWRRRRFLLFLYNLLSMCLFTVSHTHFLEGGWLKVNFYTYLACSVSDFMYFFKINKRLKGVWRSIFRSIDVDETRFSDLYPDSSYNRYYRSQRWEGSREESVDEEAISKDDEKQSE